MEKFSSEVCKALEYYVYRLIDPRNGETFYVGKGKNNRVFEHLKQCLKITEDGEDELTLKYSRIHAIHKAGLKVIHVIHRHGMNEKTAFEVEAALIDAYPGLSNEQNGHGNSEFGSMHVSEIQDKYDAPIAQFDSNHNLLHRSGGRNNIPISLLLRDTGYNLLDIFLVYHRNLFYNR